MLNRLGAAVLLRIGVGRLMFPEHNHVLILVG
jgi:hypothetical protein